MPETKETESKKPLSLTRPGRLELKKTVDAGMVKQSFSHGRSKQVSVEVKKKRTFTRGEKTGEMTEAESAAASPFAPSPGADIAREAHHGLSEAERSARMRALEDAKARHELHTPAELKALEARAAEAVEEAPKAVPPPVEAPVVAEPPAPAEPEIEAKVLVEEAPAP